MFDNYEKLNEYLKDICTYLQKKNPYLLNNIYKITTLSGTVLNLLRDFNFDVNMRENNLSIQDVESMARVIIEKLNKDYLELFDKLVESKELRFCDNEKFVGSDVYSHIEDDGKITKMVSIERKHNYSDVRILVHEFIHYTTCECFSINREILSEFLAIYFELHVVDNLLGQGIPMDEIDYTFRLEDFKTCQMYLSRYGPLLFAYLAKGKLDSDTYDAIKSSFPNISYKDYNIMCKRTYELFEHREKDYQALIEKNPKDKGYYLCNDFVLVDYKYVLGIILAIYCYKFLKTEDIIKLNDNISKYDNLSIEEILQKLGIDLYDKNFVNRMKEAFKEYIKNINMYANNDKKFLKLIKKE